MATGIKVKNGKVDGVVIRKSEVIGSRMVIANCDPFQVVRLLINGGLSEGNSNILRYMTKLGRGVTSISAFMVYIGTREKLGDRLPYRGCIWYSPTYDVSSCYSNWMDGIVDFSEDGFVFASFCL